MSYGMGVMILIAFCAVILMGCIVPLVLVACFRQTRFNKKAWLIAGVPLAFCLSCLAWFAVSWHLQDRLCDAVAEGDSATVKRLLSIGVSPDAMYMDGPTAIHLAIDHKRWHLVTVLIDAGATDTPYYHDPEMQEVEETVTARLKAAGRKDLADRLRVHSN